MKASKGLLVISFILFLLLAQPAASQGAGESATADVAITPRSETFFSNAYSSANWRVETAINTSAPFPEVLSITPMKVADLSFPPASRMTFNPKPSMPVCPDDQLGPPPTTNSIPVPAMINRCPDALLGNGTAAFALGQSTSPLATRDGEILIFNGGLVGGRPLIKIYAYSYDTTVGIYTSAVLQEDGQMLFDIPRLTSDSAVRTMNLSIPGQVTVIEKPLFDLTVTLPAGQDPSYVQAKCPDDQGFQWSAQFTLGSRDSGGNPIGPADLEVSDSGTAPCSGQVASARLGRLSVSGPAQVKRNRLTTYRVRVRNSGALAASGVRLRASGRGISLNVPVGRIGPGVTRTVPLRVRPKIAGRIRASFVARSDNAGSQIASKTIRVSR